MQLEKSQLVQEVQDYVAKLNDEAQSKGALQREKEDIQRELDEATKVKTNIFVLRK